MSKGKMSCPVSTFRIGKYRGDGIYEYQCLSCRSVKLIQASPNHCGIKFCWECGERFTCYMLYRETQRIYSPYVYQPPTWVIEEKDFEFGWMKVTEQSDRISAYESLKYYREGLGLGLGLGCTEYRVRKYSNDPLPLP